MGSLRFIFGITTLNFKQKCLIRTDIQSGNTDWAHVGSPGHKISLDPLLCYSVLLDRVPDLMFKKVYFGMVDICRTKGLGKESLLISKKYFLPYHSVLNIMLLGNSLDRQDFFSEDNDSLNLSEN